jgi:hypothetical protein
VPGCRWRRSVGFVKERSTLHNASTAAAAAAVSTTKKHYGLVYSLGDTPNFFAKVFGEIRLLVISDGIADLRKRSTLSRIISAARSNRISLMSSLGESSSNAYTFLNNCVRLRHISSAKVTSLRDLGV